MTAISAQNDRRRVVKSDEEIETYAGSVYSKQLSFEKHESDFVVDIYCKEFYGRDRCLRLNQ